MGGGGSRKEEGVEQEQKQEKEEEEEGGWREEGGGKREEQESFWRKPTIPNCCFKVVTLSDAKISAQGFRRCHVTESCFCHLVLERSPAHRSRVGR